MGKVPDPVAASIICNSSTRAYKPYIALQITADEHLNAAIGDRITLFIYNTSGDCAARL
jgi:hypothetical protein